MVNRRRIWAAGAMALAASVMGVASEARAEWEFSLGIGYGHVELDGSDSDFDGRGGVRVEPRFTFQPIDATPQFKLGVGVGISGYRHDVGDDDFTVIDDDGDVFTFDGDSYESLTLITPEVQLSWRQPIGGDSDGPGWFVEPGVGLGAIFGQYWVGDTWGYWSDTDVSEWDATFGVRPFLRAGYQSDRWIAGLEASYLFGGSLDLTDEVSGDVREFYIGGFFGGRW